jgi:hypothetical protein
MARQPCYRTIVFAPPTGETWQATKHHSPRVAELPRPGDRVHDQHKPPQSLTTARPALTFARAA